MSFADRMLVRSISGRLMIWFVGAAMLLVLMTATLLYMALAQAMIWRDDQVLQKRAATVIDLLHVPRVDADYLDHEVSEDLEGPRQFFMRISGPPEIGFHETPLMPASLTFARYSDVSSARDGTLHYAISKDDKGRTFRTLILRTHVETPSGGGWVTIQMAIETSLDSEILIRYAELIAVVVIVGLGLALLSGWVIVRTHMKPLKSWVGELAKIEHSTPGYRVPLDGLPSELSEAAVQFNQMLARLEMAYGGLKRYADDVAHELRTPLNRIQLGAEVALNEPRTEEDYRNVLEATLEECEHLNKMVRSLLFIARAEHGQEAISREPFDVARSLEKIRTYFEDSASEACIQLTLDCSPDLSLSGDNTLFQRAVSNIVANALYHTPSGGSVSLRAVNVHTGIEVQVSDTGDGIAAHLQPYVFDRFFRGDTSRRTDQDRVGLGLAITKSVVDLHGGRISLESCIGRGSRFTLFFPNT